MLGWPDTNPIKYVSLGMITLGSDNDNDGAFHLCLLLRAGFQCKCDFRICPYLDIHTISYTVIYKHA